MIRHSIALLAFVLGLAGTVVAQDATPANPPVTAPAPQIDPTALESFVDGVVSSYQRDKGIAGVTVAVVSRDQVLLQKGYGVSNLEPRRAVDPAGTLFRVASISKTFTYVMTMQLVAEGKLDLNAPADTYLPEELRFAGDGYKTPRLLDLMQHTAGFEDSALGHLFTTGQAPMSLHDYLVHYRPRRVREPGIAAVYSNYSVALLGYIVATIDGKPFEDDVEARVLTPLGIKDYVTFREPGGNEAMHIIPSEGYKRTAGWVKPVPALVISQIAPAAAASATASGMARYMRMLLNGGALDGVTVLKPESFAELITPTFRNAPGTGAIAHGFFRRSYGSLLSMEHDGAALEFYSNMVIWPDAGLAIFVAVNTDSGPALIDDLPRQLIEHFVPSARPTDPKPGQVSDADRQALAGSYIVARRNQSTFEGFLDHIVMVNSVTPMPDGSLAIQLGGDTVRVIMETRDDLRAIDSGAKLRVLRDDAGTVTGLSSASSSNVMQRIGFLDEPITLFTALGLTMFASLWCLIAFVERLLYWAGRHQSVAEYLCSGAEIITAVLWLAAPVALVLAALPMLDQDTAVRAYPGPLLPGAQILLHVAAGASLVLLILLLPVWISRTWRFRRLTFSAYALLGTATAFLLWHWGALLTPMTIMH